MLQTLLAERFKLVARHGAKEMPVYALVVSKGGPSPSLHKLRDREDSPSPTGFQSGDAPEFAGHGRGQGMVLKGVTMQEFAQSLSGSQAHGRDCNYWAAPYWRGQVSRVFTTFA
jgi:uncharacterized protein (TIGR03435 family)